jgi:thioredoxin reductase (NADPH)
MTSDIAIIGGGPAGLTAALYAGRAKFKTIVLEKAACGGQVLLTEMIENFPGIIRMESLAWVESQKKQLEALSDVTVIEESGAVLLEKNGGLFKIHTLSGLRGNKDIVEARAVIVASGAQPKRLGILGEEALTGRGVSYCAICDGPLFSGKDVVVVGGGDSALDEALYLAKLAKKVTLVHRRDAFRAAAILQERVRENSVITLALENVPIEVKGTSKVESIKLRSVKTGSESVVPCDAVFIFIGHMADTGLLKNLVSMSADGHIMTDQMLATSWPGVFACGDCRERPLHQVVTACSDGAVAAYAAGKYLDHGTS